MKSFVHYSPQSGHMNFDTVNLETGMLMVVRGCQGFPQYKQIANFPTALPQKKRPLVVALYS